MKKKYYFIISIITVILIGFIGCLYYLKKDKLSSNEIVNNSVNNDEFVENYATNLDVDTKYVEVGSKIRKNISEKVKDDHFFESYAIKDFKIVSDINSRYAKSSFTFVNNSDNDLNNFYFKVNYYDDSSQKLLEIVYYIDHLDKKDKTIISEETDYSILGIYDYSFESIIMGGY